MGNEEERLRKNLAKEVRLSPFILQTKDGEIMFFLDPPCPRCNFWMGGEYAGAFQCEVCGYSEVPQYSSRHGTSLLLEGLWKVLSVCLFSRRLKWETSRVLYSLYSSLRTWYLLSKRYITYVEGDYIWSWEEKRWIKFV